MRERFLDREPSIAKETIILVHGTFAAPKPGIRQWYQRHSNDDEVTSFITMLERGLTELGSPAKCWAHSPNKDESFCWSGGNEWIDRHEAAMQLAELIERLARDDWYVHIVAHSHGGNVAMDALKLRYANGTPNSTNSLRSLLLGHPS